MVINSAPISLPLSTANLPTETVRNETRLQERVPEAKPTTENVKLKPSTEETSSSAQRSETRSADGSQAERNVQERGEQQQGQQNSEQRQSGDQSERQSRQEVREQREEQVEVQQLKARDREVRAHEAAHASVGGNLAGSPSYDFKRGPDGQRYAVGGEVPIDVAAVPGDPAATIRKMQQVRRAALAPRDPSSQDQAVAAQATAREAQARAELQEKRTQEQDNESAQTRFEGRLRKLGVIEQPENGDRVSVVA